MDREFRRPDSNNGGPNTNFVGHGVLGTNFYWNVLSGSLFANTPPSLLDDGQTVSGINLGATNYGNGSWYGVGNLLLLDQFCFFGTNGTSFVFSNVPNGRYNLAAYLCDGPDLNRGTTITVKGVPKSIANAQDMFFLPDNTVIYTNLVVTNGMLEMHLQPYDVPLHPPNTEGDFNGAQLELITAGPRPYPPVWNGTNLTLTWVGGGLQESTNVLGPWVTNPGVSPFTFTPTGYMQFFRVYNPNF